ncbi:hypothetical protein B0T26DRAFT_806677 [Lasiosphaeria miniovina]|uniref:Uncharacterized protein n=1 Tax=Lasiosphaeria miniovina TaxID=1954250 RepID=A0AA40A0H2_9PEZI|nr:uncharacterized protein B0T26DRAFT_806677 [Lasiosphaeria miniovina]KAK0707051.1 hypothetical protein B0T26DRAFT_806677 [Lasiosphaeria miniovina]
MPLLSRLRPEANDCWRPGALYTSATKTRRYLFPFYRGHAFLYRCREKSLTCRAPPNAKRCAECTRVGNMHCGLDGPDHRHPFFFEVSGVLTRLPVRALQYEPISLDEEAAALQAAAAAKFAERSAAAAAEFAAESAAAAEKSRLATARRRRVHRQRVAFQAKISRLVAHEDAAVAELEEEERLEPLAAPEAAPPVSLFSTDWGAVDIDQALAFGSPEPLPSLFSG